MTATPRDDQAEAALVGIAVSHHGAYRLAAGRVAPKDFWAPSMRRLFEACAVMVHLDGSDIDTEDSRIHVAAATAEVDLLAVRSLVESRPLMWDRNGTYAARVTRAARARAVMAACATVFNRLGDGEPLDVVLADVTDLFRGAA